MARRNLLDTHTVELKLEFPPLTELIARAERITESCVHPEQVTVGRNFLMNVARRGTDCRVYTVNDLEMVKVLVDHMAKRQTTRIYQKEEVYTLH
jgi:hypothetical protein